ncbi:MAG: type 4a pilus biogenesis protein PilO [Sulfurospirillum sp.]|nr:type 4a pilus biogenesis protein PilO [Sulfurospirillum sp.]
MNETKIADKIDSYLKNKKSNEQYLIFLMIFIVIGFLIYSFLFPVTKKMVIKTENSQKSIKLKLEHEKIYLNSITKNGDKQFILKKIDGEVNKLKIVFSDKQFANTYIDTKLKELSYLLFNDKNWARFLNSIAFIGEKYDVEIELINNNFFVSSLQEIKQVLTVKINFNGEFKNILKFINELEESDLVVDINNLNLKSSNTIIGTLDIAVWGMKY